jgi:copper chaperone CopZ
MKRYLAATGLILAFASLLIAEEARATRYTVSMTGVVCSACKKNVRTAFGKMGASKIEIKAGPKEGEQTVTFESAGARLTKAEAIKALGESASEYKVLAFAANP